MQAPMLAACSAAACRWPPTAAEGMALQQEDHPPTGGGWVPSAPGCCATPPHLRSPVSSTPAPEASNENTVKALILRRICHPQCSGIKYHISS
jgi:hypothetical protein